MRERQGPDMRGETVVQEKQTEPPAVEEGCVSRNCAEARSTMALYYIVSLSSRVKRR